MKQIFTLLLVLTFSGSILSQADGPYDPTFDGDGIVKIEGIGDIRINAVDIQSDGKIVCAGYMNVDNQKDYMFLRINEDGTPDATFGDGGLLTADAYNSGYEELLTSVKVLSTGEIIAGGVRNYNGQTDFDAFAVKINADGSLVDSYGYNDGYTSYGFSSSEYFYGSRCHADGSISLIGDSFDGTNSNTTVANFDENGSIITFTALPIPANFFFRGVDQDQEGNTYFAGGDGSLLAIGKVNGAGELVADFNGDGVITFEATPNASNPFFTDLMVGQNDKLLLCGQSGSDIVIARQNSTDGGADVTFNNGSRVVVDVWGGNDIAAKIAEFPNGKILVIGSSDYGSGDYDMALIRLNADGSRDNTFDENGIVYYHSQTDFGTACTITPEGKMIATGYVSETDPFVIRYADAVTSASQVVLPAAADIDLYPNPTTSSEIQLDYLLEEKTAIQVDLFSLNGQKVSNLLMADELVGPQSDLLFLPNNLASGMYLIRIQTVVGLSTIKISVQQ